MKLHHLLGLAVFALSFVNVGCGGTEEAVADAGQEMLDPVAAYLLDGTPATLDLTCQSVSTRPPTTGADTTFTLTTADYQSGDLLTGIPVNFHPDNIVGADLACTGNCISGTSDGASHLSVHSPLGAWFAFHIPARDCSVPSNCMTPATTPITTVQYNVPTPAEGETLNAKTVSLATLNLIPSVLGVVRQGSTGLIAGTFRDCAGNYLQNLQARVYRPDGTLVVAPPNAHTSPAYRYFNGNQEPDATQTHSNKDGLFGALNMPVPADGAEVRVEGWGNVGGELHMISCENIRIFEDGVAILNVYPDRADGPSNCSE